MKLRVRIPFGGDGTTFTVTADGCTYPPEQAILGFPVRDVLIALRRRAGVDVRKLRHHVPNPPYSAGSWWDGEVEIDHVTEAAVCAASSAARGDANAAVLLIQLLPELDFYAARDIEFAIAAQRLPQCSAPVGTQWRGAEHTHRACGLPAIASRLSNRGPVCAGHEQYEPAVVRGWLRCGCA